MARKDITDEQVLEAYMSRDRMFSSEHPAYTRESLGEGPYVLSILKLETGQPEKVCWRAMERAYDRGLLEFGVSLGSGWLTEKGEMLLAIHRKAITLGENVGGVPYPVAPTDPGNDVYKNLLEKTNEEINRIYKID